MDGNLGIMERRYLETHECVNAKRDDAVMQLKLVSEKSNELGISRHSGENRSPDVLKVFRFTGFRLEFIRLRQAGMTQKRTLQVFFEFAKGSLCSRVKGLESGNRQRPQFP